ncbi:hypothetical protein PMI14_06748 [Acidovorax sp. CF316]|uniref:hypothetical protein n=1 Tax=Acidovorax sp. CF316 TaxID=1144317 RepID=UPI00026BDFC2|nr:hypothetical protein [Acidovorax sp. CF316]EJE48811.1 hypothetical protein PMI14_06748 [Acidovorax sp. CF316]
MTAQEETLACAILRALAEESRGQDGAAAPGVSLPRLGKRLGQGVSVLLRELTLMSGAAMGGQRGPGWVRVDQVGERWVAHLTDAGRAVARELPAAGEAP